MEGYYRTLWVLFASAFSVKSNRRNTIVSNVYKNPRFCAPLLKLGGDYGSTAFGRDLHNLEVTFREEEYLCRSNNVTLSDTNTDCLPHLNNDNDTWIWFLCRRRIGQLGITTGWLRLFSRFCWHRSKSCFSIRNNLMCHPVYIYVEMAALTYFVEST